MVLLFQKLISIGALIPFTKSVILILFAILINQAFYLVYRQNNRGHLRLIILLLIYILYNIETLFFLDYQIKLDYDLQAQIVYSFPILMTYYLTFYIYKLLNNESLFKLLILIPLFTLLTPCVLFFLVPYLVTRNEILASRMVTVIPGIYSFLILFRINLIMIKEYRHNHILLNNINLKIIAANIGILVHIGIMAMQFFGKEPADIIIAADIGILTISFMFLFILIIDNQKKYEKLQKSEKVSLEYMDELERKVLQKTKDLDLLYEQRKNTLLRLAHETRTPITLIKNNLSDIKGNNGLTREIENMNKNLQQLDDQISNILNHYKPTKL